jgi:hypothetical protein
MNWDNEYAENGVVNQEDAERFTHSLLEERIKEEYNEAITDAIEVVSGSFDRDYLIKELKKLRK